LISAVFLNVMKAVLLAAVLLACSVDARFLETRVTPGNSVDTEVESAADLEDRVDDALDGEANAINALDKGPAANVVSANSSQPVGFLNAGPWNRTHVTMTVSSGFDCPYNNDKDYDSDEDDPQMNVRCAELELLVNDVEDTEHKLMQNLNDQSSVQIKLSELAEEDPGQVKKYSAVVSDETSSPALGSFLGDFWREMRMFVQPSFSKYLEGKQRDLESEESELRAALQTAKKAVAELKEKYAAEDEARRLRQLEAGVDDAEVDDDSEDNSEDDADDDESDDGK